MQVEENLINDQAQAQEVKEPAKRFEYKTTILYDNKVNEQIITVEPPQCNQLGILHLLKQDRLICVNTAKVVRWETEQLGEILQNKIIVGEK